MTKKYILALLIFFVLIIATYFIGNNITDDTAYVKDVYNNIESIENCTMDQISVTDERYCINAFYPITKYETLNNEVLKLVNSKMDMFKEDVEKSLELTDKVFTLDIKFNISSYNEFISIEFDIFYDFGGAHPNTYTETINYNSKEDKIVTIDDLMKKNDDLLNKLHDYFYNKLKENERLKQVYNERMFEDGLRPIKENFKNFVFTKEGMIFIFNRYQIAPYVAGDFRELIIYDNINI